MTPTPTVGCANGGLLFKPNLRITKNLPPPGDEALTFSGELYLTSYLQSIDPSANGFQFAVLDTSGNTGLPGWTTKRSGTRWMYRDPGGTLAGGITNVTISYLATRSPLTFRFRVRGKNSNFHVASSALPLQAIAILGGAAQAAIGECAEYRFAPVSGDHPRCQIGTIGSVVRCW